MLFNTQAYAWFLGVVFIVTWILAEPTKKLWSPWVAVAAFAVYNARALPQTLAPFGAIELGLVGLAGGVTWLLDWTYVGRRAQRHLLASCLCSGLLFFWLSQRAFGTDPLTLGIRTFGIPGTGGSHGPWAQALLGAVLVAFCFALLRARRARLVFVLLASYTFYAQWDYRFLPLIFGSSTIDYWLGQKIGRTTEANARRRWLALTVVVNLGVLAVFKYFDFGVESARAGLTALGFSPPDWTLQIALPVGISFFTFESMSYVIDVYRKELPAHKSYLEYLSFVAFFPHLVAGPIVRPRDLLPQLSRQSRFSVQTSSEGLFLISIGLLKKTAIGDYLALNLVDRVFDAPTQYSSLECYAGTLGYAVQIYCDFSGYTDIAIGSALLLGVRFPANFNAPYKAHDVQDFWRRWHISLSTWLRDYLYIPLGGSRKGRARTYVNLLITMVLGGLWHGANWTFVIWGALHGIALALNRALVGKRSAPRTGWGHVLGVFGTFHFVCFCWIFFRAANFAQARAVLSQLAQLTSYHPNLHWKVVCVLALGLLSHLFPEKPFRRLKEGFTVLPAPLQALALLAVAFCLREMASAEAVPFVYFQF